MKNKTIDNLSVYTEKIKQLIDSDYVYIDFPMYFNIGDSLITMGAFELLKNVEKYKCNYRSSSVCLDKAKIASSDIIIMQGGGNFGDLYRGANEFRNDIIRSFPNNKIVIFPQTIWYENMQFLIDDVDVFSSHPNLTIFVRDRRSYEFALKYFKLNKVELFPDTALFLRDSWLVGKYKKNAQNGKILFLKRHDKEAKDEYDVSDDCVIKDWDDICANNKSFGVRVYILRFISWVRRNVSIMRESCKMLQNLYFLKFLTPFLCEMAVKEFGKYDKIVTSRLHGAILALLLGIPFDIVDNKYGKTKDFFDTWFTENE